MKFEVSQLELSRSVTYKFKTLLRYYVNQRRFYPGEGPRRDCKTSNFAKIRLKLYPALAICHHLLHQCPQAGQAQLHQELTIRVGKSGPVAADKENILTYYQQCNNETVRSGEAQMRNLSRSDIEMMSLWPWLR